MIRPWETLTDEEQKQALALLHMAAQLWRMHYERPTIYLSYQKDRELLEVAIQHLDNSRRKFQEEND